MLENLIKILPAAMFMFYGWKAVVDAFLPPTPEEDPDFYRVSAEVNGVEKWSDMMRPRTAQMLSLIVGIAALLGGTLWILYVLQFWPFTPKDVPNF